MIGMEEAERDEYFMALALDEADRAFARSEVPVGAVLVSESGDVLGRGHNAPISLSDPTAHAEILAMREASTALGNYRLTGTTLYATLEPCPMCVGAMLQARVRRLVFGAPDPKSGAAGSVVDLTNGLGFNHTIEVVRGVRTEACAAILRRFFQDRRRTGKENHGEVPKWP